MGNPNEQNDFEGKGSNPADSFPFPIEGISMAFYLLVRDVESAKNMHVFVVNLCHKRRYLHT